MMQLRNNVVVDVDAGLVPLGQPADVVRAEIRSNLALVDDVEACDVRRPRRAKIYRRRIPVNSIEVANGLKPRRR